LDRLPPDRLEPDRDPLALVVRDELDRELDALARERPLGELFVLLDERRLLDLRRAPPLRSAAGISSRATAFASCSICFSRNFAMRSSSRRILRASFAVSLSPTVSASDSIPA
jgi:hypothetical protein